MCMGCTAQYAATGVAVLLASTSPGVAATAFSSQFNDFETLPAAVKMLDAPTLVEPSWLKAKRAANAAANKPARQTQAPMTVTYDVMTRGAVRANVAEFKAQANATLNDSRGWARLGVSFQEVSSGGTFTLVLAAANQMTSFSPGCGSEYSCRAGRYVIINQERWLGATPSWNNAGGSLRNYRHMVINHETGHWLGHDHASCSAAGGSAAVMQQQSIDLQGCKFNPWPLKGELWSTQLGIDRR